MCDVISDAAAEEEEAIGWMFPSSGGERAKKGSIAASPSPLPSPTYGTAYVPTYGSEYIYIYTIIYIYIYIYILDVLD